MIRTDSLPTNRRFSLYTQQWYMSYRFVDSLREVSGRTRPDPARKLSTNLYDIHHCCVYSEKRLLMGRGSVRNMQSFISKIN